MSRRRSLWKDSRGAALLEFVFCFPILFVLFLFAMQFAYIMITWQVVHYSAYMGARSAMTVNNLQRKSRAETVVKRILAVVSASPSDSSDAKDLDPRGLQCTVKFKMFLLVPVAGRIISFFAKDNKDEEESKWSEKLDQQSYALNPALLAQYANEMEVKGSDKKEKLKYPYITLTSTSVIAIPYATKFYPVTR